MRKTLSVSSAPKDYNYREHLRLNPRTARGRSFLADKSQMHKSKMKGFRGSDKAHQKYPSHGSVLFPKNQGTSTGAFTDVTHPWSDLAEITSKPGRLLGTRRGDAGTARGDGSGGDTRGGSPEFPRERGMSFAPIALRASPSPGQPTSSVR